MAARITDIASAGEGAHAHFAQQQPARVAPFHLSQRHRTDDQRDGLRAGDAAHARDDRHQHGQCSHFLDGAFEALHHEPGQDGGDEVDAEPQHAAARGRNHRREHVFFVAQTGAGHDFVRGFLGDDVHHVIDGDAAQQHTLLIHHRSGDQIAIAEQLRHFARRHIRRDARRLGVEAGAHDIVGIGREQPGQRDGAEEPVAAIHHEQPVGARPAVRRACAGNAAPPRARRPSARSPCRCSSGRRRESSGHDSTRDSRSRSSWSMLRSSCCVTFSGRSDSRSARSSTSMPSVAAASSSGSMSLISCARTSSLSSTSTSPSSSGSVISHTSSRRLGGSDSSSCAISAGCSVLIMRSAERTAPSSSAVRNAARRPALAGRVTAIWFSSGISFTGSNSWGRCRLPVWSR